MRAAMPRGVPMTPEQIEAAAKVYELTGNYSEAARAVGFDVSAVRRALINAKEPDRAKLHARACERGIREGRRSLRFALSQVETRLLAAAEGREYAAVVGAAAKATETLMGVLAHCDRVEQAALTREKTKAETELLRAKARGDVADETNVTLNDEQLEALLERKFGAKRQGTTVEMTSGEDVQQVRADEAAE